MAVGRADPDGQAEHEAFLVARFHGDPTDLIFKDGFDLGSFVAWSASATADDNLIVEASSALKGTAFGLRAFVDDVTPLFAQDDRRTTRTATARGSTSTPATSIPARPDPGGCAFVVFSGDPGRSAWPRSCSGG